MRKIFSLIVGSLMLVFLIGIRGDAIALNYPNNQKAPDTIAVPFPPSNLFHKNSNMLQAGKVEIDMFSTRANPTWMLSLADLEMLRSMLKQLPTTTPFELADNLGYRGFVVEVPEAGRVVLVKIYQNQVQYDLEGETRFFVDRDRAIETWLMQNAKSNLPEALYFKVQSQVENRSR